MTTQLDVASIAHDCLHDPLHFDTQHSQILHRLALLQHWDLSAGSKVLELGCGQGDCTTVLAHAVGEEGRVVAVDPAPLDYGESFRFPHCTECSPYTLGEAQRYISQRPVGKRINWIQEAPLDYLSSLSSLGMDILPPPSESKTFDAAVLAHSLWYFASPSDVLDTFCALKQHSRRLLVAEWSLVATHPSAQPHVLAALAQAAVECFKPESDSNVRTVLGPKRLTELAITAGWQLRCETRLQSGEQLGDGRWEVSACLSPDFEKHLEEHVFGEREKAATRATRDACEASLEGVEGGLKAVKAMDVWVATFV